MARKKGWEADLTAYIGSNARESFKPGKLDCGLFTMGAIEAMTGLDISGPFRGKYRTISAAMKIANSLGFADHVEYTASFLDEYSSPLMARRGDVVALDDMEGVPALGVVQGENIYVLGLQGLGLVPLTEAKRAFAV